MHHDDIFTYKVPSLLSDEERRAVPANHICHPRTRIDKLYNFSVSGPDDNVRLVFRGNAQRADVLLERPEALALHREIGRILDRHSEVDNDD